MNFEQVLLDLHSTLEKARSLVKECDQRLRMVIEREKDVILLQHKLDENTKNIQQREAECSKVENVVKIHKEATERYDAANLRVNAAAEAERKLNAAVDLQSKKDQETRLELEKKAKINETRAKSIDDEVTKRVQEILKKAGIKSA